MQKVKVGSKVRLIRVDDFDKKQGLNIGDTGTIDENDSLPMIDWDNGLRLPVWLDQIELVVDNNCQTIKLETNTLQVKIKKLSPEAVIPKYAKNSDGALDLTATSYKYENGRHVYGTSLALEIPEGYVGLIFPRSSICKYDLRLINAVGVVDAGYRGEVKAVFENKGMEELNSTMYQVGDRIAQMIILPYPQVEFQEVQELSSTERSTGGFGSSGK